jgi:hypothetical protein
MAQILFGTGNSTTFGTKDSVTGTWASFKRSYLSNMQIGDLLVAYIHNQSGATSQTITAPAGWVQYGPVPGQPTWPGSRLASIYYYPIKSQTDLNNIPATVTWSFSIYGSRVACVVARATGIDLDDIEDVEAATVTAGASNATSLSIAGVTTVNTTTLLVGALYHHNSVSTTSPATTSFMTEFEEYRTADTGTSLANSGVALGYTDLSAAGATGNIGATFSTAATASGGFLVAFKAGAWIAPAAAGQAAKYTSATDTLSDSALWITSATDTLKSPAEVRYMPTGYASVTSMLATSPFYIGHRGGSLDWPEMSLYAYTQAAFWGAGALELSLARTSDGVWFGLHDATLDRTSGTSGFVASEHTWAEVQAYSITSSGTTDPTQSSQPYMQFSELMDAYYDSHLFMIDPKDALAHIDELLDLMDAQPGTPTEKFISKYYGPVTTWAVAASARGYKTWGYFYNTNAADLPTYEGFYDILGMEYGASASTWTTVTSYGKPVIAHTIQSNTDATTALSRGASGMMVSGVEEVIPRP